MSSIEEMAAAMKQYVDDPVPFVRNVLDVSPDDWQVDALRGLGSNARDGPRRHLCCFLLFPCYRALPLKNLLHLRCCGTANRKRCLRNLRPG